MIRYELNQTRLKGGQRLPFALVERVLRVVAKELNIKKTLTVSIAFLSDREIRRLNGSYRGKDAVTDVLSFGTEAWKEGIQKRTGKPAWTTETSENEIGDVLISYSQAVRQAKKMKHSSRDEVVFLLVHGMLHLLGFDHEQSRDAKKMFAHQDRILETLGIQTRLSYD